MKANGTQTSIKKDILVVVLTTFLTCISLAAFTQPDYNFSTKTLLSGTDRQLGAIYRYTNVKPGHDAILEITDITPGVTVTEMDGTSGYPEAIQPTLRNTANTKGHLEMTITFVLAGTFTPSNQLEVPVTCIDVDGQTGTGGSINEYDEIYLNGGGFMDYDMLAGELLVVESGGWFIGNNIGNIDYPGRDTSATQVMFSTVNANLSTLIIRVGVDNKTTTTSSRLRSVYFKRFRYPNSFLSTPCLTAFTGVQKQGKVELQWNLAKCNPLTTVVVEKTNNPNVFTAAATIWVNTEENKTSYNYTDNNAAGKTYYRLKMISANGIVTYSNVLVFNNTEKAGTAFKVYPTTVNDNATISVTATAASQAQLQVFDMNGRVVMQRPIALQQGANTITVNGFSQLPSGNYVAGILNAGQLQTQKIMVQ
jgi:Secretion system C-terminal sorting domain